jgi:hypothetical protein
MDNQTLIWVIVAVVVLVAVAALVAWLVARKRRSSALQDRFGPEYSRTVESSDDKRSAERELQERAKRRDELDIRPLDPAACERYASNWRQVQEQFVDRPAEAVEDAQSLVTQVMTDRGYPVDDSASDVLSVDHADVMDEYRSARDISQLNRRQEATTEQLRQAMVHYRSLFGRLLESDGGQRDAVHPYPDRDAQRRSTERS